MASKTTSNLRCKDAAWSHNLRDKRITLSMRSSYGTHFKSAAHIIKQLNSSKPMTSTPSGWEVKYSLLHPSAHVLRWFRTLLGVKDSSKIRNRSNMMMSSSTLSLPSPSTVKDATCASQACWRLLISLSFKNCLVSRTRLILGAVVSLERDESRDDNWSRSSAKSRLPSLRCPMTVSALQVTHVVIDLLRAMFAPARRESSMS
mmetsp:Transcript_86480/g.249536  ORF Transcript_86480/g.249536 Transcript_86480/m.249536 type:complete len:203 (-) Transcript_86480:140-748(-)